LHNTGPREPEHSIRDDDGAGDRAPAAWEMIETGRYMPRRIRGSFPGRELG
jgi:hypothetical protein